MHGRQEKYILNFSRKLKKNTVLYTSYVLEDRIKKERRDTGCEHVDRIISLLNWKQWLAVLKAVKEGRSVGTVELFTIRATISTSRKREVTKRELGFIITLCYY